MDAHAMLQPVFVMALLSTAMFVWMLATRLPAMSKAGMDPQDAADTSALKALPLRVSQVADNYNHLFEQPTVFYAVAIGLVVGGLVDPLHVQCAWAFTILRILHSVVQATINVVNIRFALFALAWLVLAVMIVRALLALF